MTPEEKDKFYKDYECTIEKDVVRTDRCVERVKRAHEKTTDLFERKYELYFLLYKTLPRPGAGDACDSSSGILRSSKRERGGKRGEKREVKKRGGDEESSDEGHVVVISGVIHSMLARTT